MGDKRKADRAAAPLPDIAIVTVTLDRATGKVDYDPTFSTPLETWSMLSVACSKASDHIDQVNDLPTEDAP